MKKRLYLVIYILVALLSPQHVEAQDNNESRQIYLQAEEEYQVGRLEQALKLLQTNINDFDGNLKQNAYRLIALCYLAQDNTSQTGTYAKLLLQENPYYTSIQDPVRFEDMIKRLKTGRSATVTTASSQAESINEAPVPVTIITAEMIEMLGYNKNLNQILAAYIPGVSVVASSTLDNIAMHGAYSTGQEKILIMENGHRLNARSTNLGRTDYAINTQKIDHIEVLRGPASSLYGNVALTAVVNIITKEGTSINGISAQYGYGSLHTHKADLLAGTHFMNCDISAWASFYSSAGEDRYISPERDQSLDIYRAVAPTTYGGYCHINKYADKPSYDVGVNLKLNDFSLMYSRKSGKKAHQYSMLGQVFSYDDYRRYDGNKPGYAMDENHADIGYKKSWGNFSFNASVYGDWYNIDDYSVASDAMKYSAFNEDGTPMKDEDGNPVYTEWNGAYQIYGWKEMTVGTTMRGDCNYTLGGMNGNILAGMQYEYFSMYDSYAIVGQDFDAIQFLVRESENPVLSGRENIISFFLQDKHYFTKKLILNAGLRFDSKYRANGTRINALSPRLAFIYTPRTDFSMKLSYSRSFVDAPYFYRRNTDNSYLGAEGLKSEYLNAIQFDVLGEIAPIHLSYDVNLFYNKFTDIIYAIPGAKLEDVKYRNSGKLDIIGAEMDVHYNYKRLRADLTASYTHLLSAKDYYYHDNHIFSVPNFVTNGVFSYKLLNKASNNLWITSNIRFSTNSYIQKVNAEVYEEEKMPSNIIFDLGARYQMGNHMTLRVDCENIFDKTTYTSGAMVVAMPWYNPGRTLMASVNFKL
jgi:iron complex outermembrane receptor protein